jgi:hypothetical protein
MGVLFVVIRMYPAAVVRREHEFVGDISRDLVDGCTITIKLGVYLEDFGRHSPASYVVKSFAERWGNFKPLGFGVAREAISELIGPHHLEARAKGVPEDIRTVFVLVQNQSLSHTRPVLLVSREDNRKR